MSSTDYEALAEQVSGSTKVTIELPDDIIRMLMSDTGDEPVSARIERLVLDDCAGNKISPWHLDNVKALLHGAWHVLDSMPELGVCVTANALILMAIGELNELKRLARGSEQPRPVADADY